jgi:3-oxoacyl-[acyl-carrier protein] reductase
MSTNPRYFVVTGASRGIGQAIARSLAQDGAHVLVHYFQNEAGADETVSIAPDRMVSFPADLSQEHDRRALVEFAWQWSENTIHGWVNNAGADVLTGERKDASFVEKLDRLWEVDVRGTLLISRLVVERLRKQPKSLPRPQLLFIGWDQAWSGMEGDAGQFFAATKGAVMGMAMSLARELAPDIRVNCLAPGWIRTAWGQEASTDWQARAQRESLSARWGIPEDIAAIAHFLFQPQADFLNGQIIHVNGGRSSNV